MKTTLALILVHVTICRSPANMRRWPNAGLLLGQRRGRLAYSELTLGQRLMFARRLRMGRGDHLDQSEAYDIS